MTSAAEAQQLLRDGRVNEAEKAFQAILETDPEHVEALNVTGLIALRDGATARALSLLGRAAALPAPNQLADEYERALRQRLAVAGWSRAESEPVLAALAGSPPAEVPPGLYQLHRDLTGLRHAHAGASW